MDEKRGDIFAFFHFASRYFWQLAEVSIIRSTHSYCFTSRYYHNMDDALIDFLLSACNIGWTHQTMNYDVPNPYQFTERIIIAAQKDKAEASRLLETYIKKKWNAEDGWSYESAAVAKILGLDDSRLRNSSHYPYELVHYKNMREFPDSFYSDWLKNIYERQQGAQRLEKEKEFIHMVETDYTALEEQDFYEKYRERFLMELFPDAASYRNFRKEKGNAILGFLLVNALVTDGYILQMDFKDEPEEYLPDFVNERLETDYGVEQIELESVKSSENMDASTGMYDTKYVKAVQRKRKRKGFCLIWFLLDNDQYYTAVVPKKTVLGSTWN